MGRQINFYLAADDEATFLANLGRFGGYVLCPRNAKFRPRQERVPSHPATAAFLPFNVDYCIIPKAPWVRKLRVDRLGNNGPHSVDILNSDVIEFTRSLLVDGPTKRYGPAPKIPFLEHGRLWYGTCDLDGAPRCEAFLKWADSVLRGLRRKLTKGSNGNYVGAEAARLAASGSVQLGPPEHHEEINEAEVLSEAVRRGREFVQGIRPADDGK